MADDAQLKVRLLRSLKAKVDTGAHVSRRTLNAEIVARLERTFIEDEERNKLADRAIFSSLSPDVANTIYEWLAALEIQVQGLVPDFTVHSRIDALSKEVDALRANLEAPTGPGGRTSPHSSTPAALSMNSSPSLT